MSDRLLEGWFSEGRDSKLLVAVVLLMWLTTPWLGVWEPWEADQATVVDLVKADQTWLQVRLPVKADEYRHVAELPFGFWPVLVSTTVLGTSEMALRLPGLLLGLGVILLLFGTTRRFYGRLAAWLAVLGLLTMPLFTYHARLALGAGVSTAFIALGSLAFIRAATEHVSGGWMWFGWVCAAAAGLCGGVPALAVPVLVGASAAWTRALSEPAGPSAWRRVFDPLATGLALAVVALGWWRASVYMPDGAGLEHLLLWTDPLGGAGSAANRPSFDTFVHQIGFGLFPLGALVPLAFADLLWHPERDDESTLGRWAPPAMAAWFAAAFLGPALGAPYSHLALFTGAPVVALVVGVYLARAVRSPPQPLLAIAAVVLIALLDSNMKHDTHFLADAMVGSTVDAFPPDLRGWGLARLLDMGLLGVILLYQGGLRNFVAAAAKLLYPAERPGLLSLWRVVGAAVLTGLVVAVFRDGLEDLLAQRFWVRMKVGARQAILVASLAVVSYGVLYLAWRRWFSWLSGRAQVDPSERKAVRLGAWLEQRLEWRPLRAIAIVGVLLSWGLFQNVWVAHALTQNFSQKGLTKVWSDRAQRGEDLFKYKVDERNSTFYTRDLEALESKRFIEMAKADQRFFAIVPRDQLARINTEFRKATTRTLPVLDDQSFRFLLVSNQLDEGEDDRNPITRALVDELPGDAHKSNIIFRERDGGKDAVELLGWKMVPEFPSPGSPLRMILYWKVLKDMRTNWKVFVHLDAAGQRIHGDHDPVEGLYPTSDWTKGDLIADEHRVVVKRTISRANFTFYVGLYRGSTRMKIHKGRKDNDNRANLGTVRVK